MCFPVRPRAGRLQSKITQLDLKFDEIRTQIKTDFGRHLGHCVHHCSNGQRGLRLFSDYRRQACCGGCVCHGDWDRSHSFFPERRRLYGRAFVQRPTRVIGFCGWIMGEFGPCRCGRALSGFRGESFHFVHGIRWLNRVYPADSGAGHNVSAQSDRQRVREISEISARFLLLEPWRQDKLPLWPADQRRDQRPYSQVTGLRLHS